MTVLSTLCSTFPRISRARADGRRAPCFVFCTGTVAAGLAVRARRWLFFVEEGVGAVTAGASWFGAVVSIARGGEGDVRATRASETESAIRITFKARLTDRSAGASRRFRGLETIVPGR
jgi:hypothetical protein